MSSTNFIILFCILSLIVNFSFSYKILVIFGHPGKSHFDAFKSLFKELAGRGHELTILGHVPINNITNIRYIPFREDKPLENEIDLQGDTVALNSVFYYLQQIRQIENFASTFCELDLSGLGFQNFLLEELEFDIILGEMYNTNCYYGLVTKFKVPFIGLSSTSLMPWHYSWFDIPLDIRTSSNIFGGYKWPMTLCAQLENAFLHILSYLTYNLWIYPNDKKLSNKYIGVNPADPANASFLLVNSHYTTDNAIALPPNVIEIGGIHLENRDPKEIPQDIGAWLNNSADGVIYFSLGSMIKSDTIPLQQLKAFTNVFSRLAQRVLWKWESDTMPNKPDNVMIVKYMPQFEILCHPNVKLFITHGGKLGTTEATYCGVPMILLPQFGDQLYNSYGIVNRGNGIILNLALASETTILHAIRTAFRLSKHAKINSKKFRNRPVSPMTNAVYWIEHVAKYKGAQHMRPVRHKAIAESCLYSFFYVFRFISIPALTIMLVQYVHFFPRLGNFLNQYIL
ncbi:hypothetical protein ABEB36_004398 [Hypothenemus hampei]|uniref:UDP-glucuronosyltransferase n=1 Tax=Hypothenemus hampei TaxID=57062 RepID=A0ABD1F5W7_HYPHA